MADFGGIDKVKPSLGWKPEIGNTSRYEASAAEQQTDSYHSLSYLKNLLNQIDREASELIKDSETKLQTFNMLTDVDLNLVKAQEAEWPSELGEPSTYVSYSQYKSLENKYTRGAKFIRKTYEDNIRGPAGTNAIDMISVSTAFKSEVKNINNFLDDTMETTNDSSQHRALELLQDWAEFTLQETRVFRNHFSKGVAKTPIPKTELDKLSPVLAAKYQAVFQIKVNVANKELIKSIQEIEKYSNQNSEIFFNRVIGPAIKMQKSSISSLIEEANPKSFLGQLAKQAVGVVGSDVVSALTDQFTRNKILETKIGEFKERLVARDAYTSYMKELETVGKPIPSPFFDGDIDQAQLEYFQDKITAAKLENEVANSTDSTDNTFKSQHNDLDGTDSDAAHPQYLLKSGGLVTGDIAVDTDVKIDGINLSQHRHDGVDGSAKITGSDLTWGTLPEEVVDPTPPPTPTGLSLKLLQTKAIPPGMLIVDGIIEWVGDSDYTYELQLVKDQ